MKRLVEESSYGFESFLGERITLFCANYIYTGKLTGVNECFLQLQEASIVYETGAFDDPKWKDAQPLPQALHVMKQSIESWSILK
jgi:hypothetical protein